MANADWKVGMLLKLPPGGLGIVECRACSSYSLIPALFQHVQAKNDHVSVKRFFRWSVSSGGV